MNNHLYFAKATKSRFFSSLICITVLAFAPACCKRDKKSICKKEDVNTMIELDNSVFEVEEIDADNDQKANAKF